MTLTDTERRVLGMPTLAERMRRYSCGNCFYFKRPKGAAQVQCTALGNGGYAACRADLPLGVRPRLFREVDR